MIRVPFLLYSSAARLPRNPNAHSVVNGTPYFVSVGGGLHTPLMERCGTWGEHQGVRLRFQRKAKRARGETLLALLGGWSGDFGDWEPVPMYPYDRTGF